MRIMHVFHHYRPCRGGIESVILELNRKMHEKGHKCGVLCLNKCPKSREKLPASENFAEALVQRVGFLDLGFYKLAPFWTARLKGADVVHVHGLGFFSDFLALTKFLHRKPLVLSTHGGIFHTKRLAILKKIYFSVWCRLVLRAYSKVVAVSRQDHVLFKEIVPEGKLELVENGIDADKMQAFQGKPERNDFLFVGRLSKNKGLYELLEALAVVKKERPDFTLRIVGKEFDLGKADLVKRARELGVEKNVKVLGEVSDKKLMDTYRISGVFASASQYEGFGISAVEAMAAGLVPILNAIDSFKGFVKQGKNGFIADFSDKGKAAGTILKLMKMNAAGRRSLGNKAKEFASQFNWGTKAAEYESVYSACVK